MAQQQPISETKALSFFDAEAVSAWLTIYGKNLIYGIGALFALILLVYLFGFRNTELTEKAYQQAANDFVVLVRASPNDTEAQEQALKSLQTLMTKHKDIRAAYEGTIAQILINRGDSSGALPLAQQTLNRTAADKLEYYQDYAQTTLLILEEKYTDALAKAQALQGRIDNEIATVNSWDERSFGPELLPLNLFRIGMLQQQLGDRTGEIATWKQWNTYAGLAPQEGNASHR